MLPRTSRWALLTLVVMMFGVLLPITDAKACAGGGEVAAPGPSWLDLYIGAKCTFAKWTGVGTQCAPEVQLTKQELADKAAMSASASAGEKTKIIPPLCGSQPKPKSP